ncbi:SRPBCC domain-containing protein [Inquilinus sp. Marseille-Q2685]|uniref:SRPBCC domain-containing protein n=1 Tax=Inquilinus sp. Marseille-Q2685 TaxID=2866581 RepID=UPI001CE4A007|nr:SRPBCC domain-containing protein [Inquilinus sp. Marseille-Q2685]
MTTASNDSPETELVITRVFDAPRSLVFKAWTEPEHLARWLGPKDFGASAVRIDLRPGGAWSAVITSPEGKSYGMAGVYREIAPPERLVFTFAWDEEEAERMLIALTFRERDGRTEMTFRQTGFRSVESRDSHRDGWSECFDKLPAALAQI